MEDNYVIRNSTGQYYKGTDSWADDVELAYTTDIIEASVIALKYSAPFYECSIIKKK